MDAIEAIRTRRMLPRVGTKRPERAEIQELLELAVRAPNHHRTEPWRFYVVTDSELDRIARAIADEEVETKGSDPDTSLGSARKKVEGAPVIVVFTCVPSADPKVVEAEELASVAMAIENFLIGAHVRGLGAMLRTGPAAYHEAFTRCMELKAGEKVVGLVYLGYPEADRPLTERAPAAEKTKWLGWD